MSTGLGPVTYYHSLGSRSRQSTNAAQAKLHQAQQVNAIWERLLHVQVDTFAPAAPRVIPPPEPPTLRSYRKARFRTALQDMPWWRWLARHRIKDQVRRQAALEFPAVLTDMAREHERAQEEEQQRWIKLLANEPTVTMQQLEDAFADNDMPAAPVGVEGAEASIAVLAPTEEVLPERIGGVTDAGNVSLRRVPKGQRQSLLTSITFGYALVTAREAFAVAPSLQSVRIVVLRPRESTTTHGAQWACLLAALWERSALQGEDWQQCSTKHSGNALALTVQTATELLTHLPRQSLQPLDLTREPDIQQLIAAVDQDWLTEEST
ncbi:MAG: hypothetical protein ACKN9D_12060 [Actinomycetales bacterium]